MINAAIQYNCKHTVCRLMTNNKDLDLLFHTRYLVSELDKKESHTKCNIEIVCLFKSNLKTYKEVTHVGALKKVSLSRQLTFNILDLSRNPFISNHGFDNAILC
jgi:hypothetical protein